MDSSKDYILQLLKDYRKKESLIASLYIELVHPIDITADELLESLAYPHSTGNRASPSGQIPDKTMMIALNIEDILRQKRREAVFEVTSAIYRLEGENRRIDQYIRALDERRASVIRLHYIEGTPWGVIQERLDCSSRTLRRLHKEGVEMMAEAHERVQVVVS